MTNSLPLRRVAAALALGLSVQLGFAQSLPEPPKQPWPAWLEREGLVMAGNWESLSYKLRSGALAGPAETPDRGIAEFERGFSEETAQKLKSLGFNFVMIPLQKGLGLKAEHRQVELSRKFAEICHRLGMHVGVYIGGTGFYESLLAEYPDADDWFLRDSDGKYEAYNWSDTKLYYRRRLNQDHPGVRARLRDMIRVAIEDLKVDLIHLDNFSGGAPGYDEYSKKHFREFLAHKYTPEQRERRYGFSSVDHIEPPIPPGPRAPASFTDWPHDPLLRDFIEFRTWALADAYREASEYAHKLKPDILMECNSGGVYRRTGVHLAAADLPQLLPWGSAFWDEGLGSRLNPNGSLTARFRSHLLARQFNNLVFQYTSEPVAMAEALALGMQCAGDPVSFENGKLQAVPRGGKVGSTTYEFIRFFHEHQDLYRDADLVTDVGVLNTFGDSYFSPSLARRRAGTVEQTLYQGKVPFTLVPGNYPGKLDRFRAIVLPDMYFVPPELVAALHTFVHNGGGLVFTGRAAGFEDLFPNAPGKSPQRVAAGRGRVAFLPEVKFSAVSGKPAANEAEIIDALRWAAGGTLSVMVSAPETTTMAYYRQPGGRRLVHLVNYDTAHPARDVAITLEQPAASATLLSPGAAAPVSLTPETHDGHSTVRVPSLETYGIVVIER